MRALRTYVGSLALAIVHGVCAFGAQLLAELASVDQRELLGQFEWPILSCVGNFDALVDPDICQSVKNSKAKTTVVEFQRSAHSPPLEEPTKYNLEVATFLEQVLNT